MFTAEDYIQINDSIGIPAVPKSLSSFTSSMKKVEHHRKKYAIILTCLIVVLQNISDYSVAANMVWMASLVGNTSITWLPCKESRTSVPTAISSPSTAEGMIVTLCYYLLSAIFSIVGGYLGDTRLGRYKTLKLSLVFVMTGTALYGVLAGILHFNNPEGGYKVEEELGRIVYNVIVYSLLFVSVVICAAGTGIHCANIIPFGIEQFFDPYIDDNQADIDKHKLTLRKAFHLLYFVRNVGCLFTFVAISSLQEHNWIFGYCIPFICAVLAGIPLLLGKYYFIVNMPRTNTSSLFISVVKEGYKLSKVTGITRFNSGLHYLDYARKDYGGSFDKSDVNAVKQLCRIIPLLSVYMVYYLLYSQMHSTFYTQGLFYKTPSYFPYAGAEALNNLTIMVVIPLVIYKVYPYLRAKYGTISPLLKTQLGFGIIALSMVTAGILEYLRVLHADPTYNEAVPVKLNFYSLRNITVNQSLQYYYRFPQYILIAVSEVLVVVVAMEIAYVNAPQQFKSVSMGVLYTINALGTFLAAAILLLTQIVTYFVNDEHGWICQDLNAGMMYYYFYLVGGVMVVNMIVLSFKSGSFEILIDNYGTDN